MAEECKGCTGCVARQDCPKSSIFEKTVHFSKPEVLPIDKRYRREFEMSISSFGNPTVRMVVNKLPELRDSLKVEVLSQIGNFEAPETFAEFCQLVMDTELEFE